ncbi:MAG TPA: acyl-CoA thioesterase [Bacteroidales bacterium]|nr:acyl-CoA thioesterase [Bacteroidales bacterium]
MEIKERIEKSETRQFKVIFPNTLNAHETLFGGTAMQWMDEVAYITATRFTRMKMVTISTDKMQFKNAIKSGTIAEIIGKVIKVGNLKLDIRVEIRVEEMFSDIRFKAVNAIFTFAAIDSNHKPIKMELTQTTNI